MYQIVFTSEFKRNLEETTHASRCAEPAVACAAGPARPATATAARAGVAHLAFGLALRLLGAH